MKITEQGASKEESLKQGMEAKSKEFVEKGAEVYARHESNALDERAHTNYKQS
jgi:hypothetical protein